MDVFERQGRSPGRSQGQSPGRSVRVQLYGYLHPEDDGGLLGHSDEERVLQAYRRWGTEAFSRLDGAFAVVIEDRELGRVLCARDALGERSLFYRSTAGCLAVAQEPTELLELPGVSRDLDEESLARFFAVRAPRLGASYFADLRELAPGHFLVYDLGGTETGEVRTECYWPPEQIEPIRYAKDADYVEQFRSLLTVAVRRRLPASGPASVLMSGGLDSTSVAAVASESTRLGSMSWVFEELPAADERRFIDPVVKALGLDAEYILGDGGWPLRDLGTWPAYAAAPWQGLYCGLQQEAYRRARSRGVETMLTGEFGDHLFTERAFWLRDSLAAGRFRQAAMQVGAQVVEGWSSGSSGYRSPVPLRSALSRTVGWRGPRSKPPGWLTTEAAALVMRENPLPGPSARERSLQTPPALDPANALACSLEATHAARFGLEVKRPYRDRRLVEFMLGAPAFLQYRPGWSKWVLREAMKGRLPEAVRTRRHVSTLLPLARRGLVEQEATVVRELLDKKDAAWRRFVRSDWLHESFPRRLQAGQDGIESVIAWQCICLELWIQSFQEAAPAGHGGSASSPPALDSAADRAVPAAP